MEEPGKLSLKELYEEARHARDICNDREAGIRYEDLLFRDPENWETVFFTAYYSAKKNRFEDTEGTAKAISAAFEKSLDRLCAVNAEDNVSARKAFHTLMKFFNNYVDSFTAGCVSGFLYPGETGVALDKQGCLKKLRIMLSLVSRAQETIEGLSEDRLALLGEEALGTVYLPELYMKTVEIGTRYLNFTDDGRAPFIIRRSGKRLLDTIDKNTALIRETEPFYIPPYCRAREAFSHEARRKTVLLGIIAAAFFLNVALALYFVFKP